MAESGQQDRSVEVLCLQEVDENLLYLYFENTSRSGGGSVSCLTRTDHCTLLEFTHAEAAAQVLSRRYHRIQDINFIVRKPAAKDKCRLCLRGVPRSTAPWTVELYLENMMSTTDFSLTFSPAGDHILVHLQQPLTEDVQTLNEKMSRRSLQGATLTLEEVQQTDSILVEKLRPGTTLKQISDLFEEHLPDSVARVSMLSQDSAKVSFVDFESVDAVLNVPHQELILQPFFSFLQPAEDSTAQHMDRRPDSLGAEDASADVSLCQTEPSEQDSPQQTTEGHSSCWVSVPDPLRLSLLRSSHLLLDQAGVTLQIQDHDVVLTAASEQLLRQSEAAILEFLEKIAVVHFTLDKDSADFLSLGEVEEHLCQGQLQDGRPMIYSVSDCCVTLASLSQDQADQAAQKVKSQLCLFSVPVREDLQYMFSLREWPDFLQSLDLARVSVSETGDVLHVVTLQDECSHVRENIQTFFDTPIQREVDILMDPSVLKHVQNHYHQLLLDLDQVSIIPMEDQDMCGLKVHGAVPACLMAEELLRGVVSSMVSKTITMEAPGILRFFYDQECQDVVQQMQHKFRVSIRPQQQPWTPPADQDVFEVAKKRLSIRNFDREPLSNTAQSDHQTMDSGSKGHEGLSRSELLDEEVQISLAIQNSLESFHGAVRSCDKEQLQQVQQMLHQGLLVEEQSADTISMEVLVEYVMDHSRVNVGLQKRLGQRKVQQALKRSSRRSSSWYQQQCLDLIQRKHAVRVEVQDQAFLVSGFQDYVREALNDVQLLATEEAEQDLVRWSWHDPFTQEPRPYPHDAALLLEKFYQKKVEKLDLSLDHQHVQILFHTMEERQVSTGASLKVSRVHEAPDQDVMFKVPTLLPLPQDSQEFKDVSSRFYLSSSAGVKVIQVDKFENQLLLSQYQLKKSSLVHQLGHEDVERTLYHGTSELTVREILFHGFNRSFSGKNGTVLGFGVYFAVDASLSLRNTYSPPNARGHKFILVTRVLTGSFALGAAGMRSAPLKEGGASSDTPLRYDSVTDDLRAPKMFVIFNDTQAYPEYLLTCQEGSR